MNFLPTWSSPVTFGPLPCALVLRPSRSSTQMTLLTIDFLVRVVGVEDRRDGVDRALLDAWRLRLGGRDDGLGVLVGGSRALAGGSDRMIVVALDHQLGDRRVARSPLQVQDGSR